MDVTDQEKRLIQQKNLIWATAVEATVQSREDPLLAYERLLRKYDDKRPVTEHNTPVAQ